MDDHEPQLGPELAVERQPRGPGLIFPSHGQRPPHVDFNELGSGQLAVWADFHGQKLQGLRLPGINFSEKLQVVDEW